MAKGSGEFKAGLEIDVSIIGDDNTRKVMESVTSSVKTMEDHINKTRAALNQSIDTSKFGSSILSMVKKIGVLSLAIASIKKGWQELRDFLNLGLNLDSIKDVKLKSVLQKQGGEAYRENIEQRYIDLSRDMASTKSDLGLKPTDYANQIWQLIQLKGLQQYKTIKNEDGTTSTVYNENAFADLKKLLDDVGNFMLKAKQIGQPVDFQNAMGTITSTFVTRNPINVNDVSAFLATTLSSDKINNIQDILTSIQDLNKEMGQYAPNMNEVLSTIIAMNEATGTIGGAERYTDAVQRIKGFFGNKEFEGFQAKLINSISVKSKNIDELINEVGVSGILKHIGGLSKEGLASLFSGTSIQGITAERLMEMMLGGNYVGLLGNLNNVSVKGVVPPTEETFFNKVGNLTNTIRNFDANKRYIDPNYRQKMDSIHSKQREKFYKDFPILKNLAPDSITPVNKQKSQPQMQNQNQNVKVTVDVKTNDEFEKWFKVSVPFNQQTQNLSNQNPFVE